MLLQLKSATFWKKAIVLTSATLLALLFLYAAYHKLIIYKIFVEQLKESPITNGFQNILAWLIPFIEIVIALALLFRKTRMLGFYSSFFLMLLFTVYVFVLPHFFSSSVPCSCGGIISTFGWKEHFYFNLSFTLLAGTGLVLYSLLQQKKANT